MAESNAAPRQVLISARTVGPGVEVTVADDSARIVVAGPLVTSEARPGDSIAVNGVCLTAVDLADGAITWEGGTAAAEPFSQVQMEIYQRGGLLV